MEFTQNFTVVANLRHNFSPQFGNVTIFRHLKNRLFFNELPTSTEQNRTVVTYLPCLIFEYKTITK